MAEGKNQTANGGTAAIAAVLRDSAIVLAAVTGLLYIASAIFAYFYLSAFGVPPSFHALGLGELSMLGVQGFYVLLVFAVAYFSLKALGAPQWRRLVGGMIALAVVGTLPIVPKIGYGVGLTATDYASIGSGIGFPLGLIFIHLRLVRRRKARKLPLRDDESEEVLQAKRATLETQLASHQSEVEQAQERLASTETDLAELRRRFVRPAEEVVVATEKLIEARRELVESGKRLVSSDEAVLAAHGDVHRYVQRRRLLALLTAAYVACFVALPTVAQLNAVEAVYTAQWEHEPGEIDRTPVYWIGDRYVYVVTDKSGCHVHAVIGSLVSMTRRCPELITAIEP